MCNAVLTKYSNLKTDLIKFFWVLAFFHYDTLIDIQQKIDYWSFRPSALTVVGKLGKCEQIQSHSNAVLHSHPPATHRDSQLFCRKPRAASSEITRSCHMGPDQKSIRSCLQLGGIEQEHVFSSLTFISHSVGVLTAAASPDVGKDFFFLLCS